MSNVNEFGDVLSSSLDYSPLPRASSQFHAQYSLLMGQIIKIYAVDETDNNPIGEAISTVCDVRVIRHDGQTEIIKRARMLQPSFGGSIVNYFEVLGNNPGPLADKTITTRDKQPGQTVLVGFIDGKKDAPVILGMMPHPSEFAIDKRPSKSEGVYLEAEFQGVNFSVNNDGELKLELSGPRNELSDAPMNFALSSDPTSILIEKSGTITLTTKNQTIVIDNDKKSVSIETGSVTMMLDGDAGKVTIEADKIDVKGATTRLIGDKVHVSTSGDATENMVLGQVLKEFLGKLVDEITKITIIGNLGVTSPPPLNVAQFLALKAQFIETEKILSDFSFTDKS